MRWIVRGGAATLRLRVVGEHRLDRILDSDQPAIFVYWHQQLLASTPFVFSRLLATRGSLTVMISQSRDGDLATRVVTPWGLRVHRGSASRGGQQALRGLYREVAKHRSSILLLPDGPRGPARVAKPGALVLAQTSGAPIVPLAFASSRARRLGSWDRMLLPWPGSRLVAAVGEPIEVPRALDDERRETLRRRLEAELAALEREATAVLGLPTGSS